MNNKRLASLDALRGANLIFLFIVGPVLGSLCHAVPDGFMPWFFKPLSTSLVHVTWAGFSAWDIIMPLFMFMSATSIPFSMERYRSEKNYKAFAVRLLRRVAILWVLGIIVQGNFLALNPDRIYLYTNTLQSIAVGYAVAALFFMFSRWKVWIAAFLLLLFAYWGAMEYITVDGFGGGQYEPTNNLAEWVDRTVLGRFRDAAVINADGSVTFPEWYTYTWVLSSVTFAATSLAGLIAGFICKHEKLSSFMKLLIMVLAGLFLVEHGWIWSLVLPVVKHIWTSSMVCVAAGNSFLLLAIFYWWYDHSHHTAGLSFFQTFGLNSIAAYVIGEIISFRSIPEGLFYGLEQYLKDFYNPFIVLCCAAILYAVLWMMKRQKIFLKA